MSRTLLITGTSSGVGLHLAVLAASQGFTTIATMRDPDKGTALLEEAKSKNVTVHIRQLDVQDSRSVEGCIKDVLEEFGSIDVLVNNAGAGYIRTTEQATEVEIQQIVDINLMGVIRCTKAVLPLMRQARSGHIVNISSVGGLVGQPFNEIYCAAKFAVEGYTESLATYVQPAFGIKFSLIEPGGISTAFVSNIMQRMEHSGGMLNDEYKPIMDKYLGGMRERSARGEITSFQTGESVAALILDCINNPDPPLRMRTSEWSEQFCALKTNADPDGTLLRDQVTKMFL